MITFLLYNVSLNVLPMRYALIDLILIVLLLVFFIINLIKFLLINNRFTAMKERFFYRRYTLEKLKLEGCLSKNLMVFPIIIIISLFCLLFCICEWVRDSVILFQTAREVSLYSCYEGIRLVSSCVVIQIIIIVIASALYLILSIWKGAILRKVDHDSGDKL